MTGSRGGVRFLARAVVALISIALSLAIAEIALRRADHVPLLAFGALPPPTRPPAPPDVRSAADLPYLPGIPLGPGVDRAWYPRDPARDAKPAPAPDIAARAKRYEVTDPTGAFFVWNRAYLLRELCAGKRFGSLGVLDDFYVFDALGGGPYPIYRHFPNLVAPSWFRSNRFGWRGPDLALAKPAGTIRIAFVGASTTVGPYYTPLAHTEILEHWLNLWAAPRGIKVEVLNTARTGVDIDSLAAVVEQELAPLEPDLTIFYEGANSFRPALLLNVRRGRDLPGPRPNIEPTWRAESYLVLARRLRPVVQPWLTNGGREPAKPRFEIAWPPDIDEQDPVITRTPLPMNMQLDVAALERMRRALAASGGQFAPASFVWMVEDGLQLALPEHLGLYNYLNAHYPLTYAQLRRAVDFENRVFRNFARHHQLPFFDVAARAPRDPMLFTDAIHMTQQGMRLLAWVFLQEITGWLDGEVAAGRLPTAARRAGAEHPNIGPGTPELVSRSAILSQCRSRA